MKAARPLRKDITNHQFGNLKVLARAGHKGTKVAFLCVCKCGDKDLYTRDQLISPKKRIDRCHRCRYLKSYLHLIGKKFNRLTVINFSHTSKKHCYWKCLCECGSSVLVNTNVILKERSRSCGCYQKEVTSKRSSGNQYAKQHGYTKASGWRHPLYALRNGMMTRCYNSSSADYPYYQGKGIKVFEEWIQSPAAFVKWGLANGWKKGLTIDRIDPNKDYEPSNCQFLSGEENLKKMHKQRGR